MTVYGCTSAPATTEVTANLLRITAISRRSEDIRISWLSNGARTNVVQVNAGANGSYANNFSDLNLPITLPAAVEVITNHLDVGAATIVPVFYYRVRLVP